MENGWYNESGKTPVECAARANFEDVVRIISEKNATL